ncbi:hypothetical protein AKJ16_DCAP04604 [Drosera capensis]
MVAATKTTMGIQSSIGPARCSEREWMWKYGDDNVLDPNSGAIVPVLDESQRQVVSGTRRSLSKRSSELDNDEAEKTNRAGEETKEGTMAGNGNENESRLDAREQTTADDGDQMSHKM